jgi:preprotein translocase subunit SecB
MSENQPNNFADESQANQTNQSEVESGFHIQRIYLKDCSVEQPNSPEVFLEKTTPDIDIEVNVSASRLQETVFEVVVMATVTIKQNQKIAVLVEAKQAGIFEVVNFPEEQIDPIVSIACPTIIYPYLRSNIADLISRAGFQPVHLSEINFQALYEQRIQEVMEHQAQQQVAAPTLQ